MRFDRCSYSVPVEHAHQPCVVRGYLDRVEIFCEHVCVATHARATVTEQYVLEPRHYLALLRRELEYRYAADGTKQFLRVLLLLTDHPEAEVRAAVARCVALRAFNADAIENTLHNAPLDVPSS